jgi:hypothetical protein
MTCCVHPLFMTGGNMLIDNTQVILSRLYTNSIFRKEFIADKKKFYQTYTVSSETITFLEALSIPQLTFFAEGLLKKRMHEVRSLLPLSIKLIGKVFAEFFLKFCDQYTPNGIHKHQEDAIHFVEFVLAQLNETNIDQFTHSVMLYEQEQLRRFMNPKKYRLTFYKYDLVKNYGMLLKQGDLTSLPKKLNIVVWKKGKVFIKIR